MLEHFLNPVADFRSLQLQRGTNAKRLPDGAEKANVVIGTWNLNVSRKASRPFAPRAGAEGFPNAGRAVNQRQCASVPGVIERFKNPPANGGFRKRRQVGHPLAAV